MNPYIYSLQVGKVQKLSDWETGSFKDSVEEIEVFNNGIKDDEVSDTKNHGGIEKAVFANSLENYYQWQHYLGLFSLPKGALSENLTISGLHETNVFLGDIHTIGEVTLQVVQPRKPCWKISKKHQNKNFTKHIYDTGHTGWYYSVLETGRIRKNDTIKITTTQNKQISILEANQAFRDPIKYKELLEKILSFGNISKSYKQSIEKRLQGTYSLKFMELP